MKERIFFEKKILVRILGEPADNRKNFYVIPKYLLEVPPEDLRD